MPAFGLFVLTFFTLPKGMSEGQPLLVFIPIAAWVLTLMLKG
jgi:hypothetical protein